MADENTPDPSQPAGSAPPPDPNDPPELGDAGKRALTAERDARQRAERDAKAAKAELDKLRTESQSEQERAIARAKDEGRAEAVTTANERIVRAEVRAAAASKLADPADAVHFLDLSDFTVEDDGSVDSKAISKAIDQLVKEKPYLANSKASHGFDAGARQSTPDGEDDMNTRLRRATGRG